MGNTIVISQPYYFPWIGLYEQMRLADIFVHYDDVQFSRGHFQDRVQIKTVSGSHWLTIPKKNFKLGQNINEVVIDNNKEWKRSQLDFLDQAFKMAPFKAEMLYIVRSVFYNEFKYLSDLTILSTMAVADYYGLTSLNECFISSELPVEGHGIQRVLDLVKYFKANRYITGMGALKYFDFELFEKNNIIVEFLDYKKLPYPQLFSGFNPYVSILDLIANNGKEGIKYITSGTVYWKDFIKSDSVKVYLGDK